MKRFEKQALKKARELGKDSAEKDLKNIDSKLGSMKKGRVAQVWDKVLFLWEKAKSPDIPSSLKLTIIGALLYLILPADIVPDTIPGIGLIDDVSVILLVFNEVSKFVIPKAVEKTKTKLQESYYTKIDGKLKEIVQKLLINSIITFVLNLSGILILLLKLADEYSKYISIGIFTAVFIYSLLRTILYFIRYGKVSFGIAKHVLKSKSLSKGISNYVQETYPVITKVYAGINTAKQFIPGLETIPDFNEIVKDFINHFKKKVIIIISLLIMYTATISIVKMVISL